MNLFYTKNGPHLSTSFCTLYSLHSSKLYLSFVTDEFVVSYSPTPCTGTACAAFGQWFWKRANVGSTALTISHINVVGGNLKISSGLWCMTSMQNRWANERSCRDNTTSNIVICEFVGQGLSPVGMVYFKLHLIEYSATIDIVWMIWNKCWISTNNLYPSPNKIYVQT